MSNQIYLDAARWNSLQLIQETFPKFEEFLDYGMNFLGFDNASDIQLDIAEFLQYGPSKLMVQAQRGQAKTTITALLVVWILIHDPSMRFLIVSAGGDTAKAIAGLVIKLINQMDILECLRPDTSFGDRCSVEAFDVHHALRNVTKDASVACVSVMGTMTSKRADIIIADDVEAPTNSETAIMREKLFVRTLEFHDLIVHERSLGGRMIYLGTPQSIDSIYNTLPSRGFTVRVWPGRYPTQEQIGFYNGNLAPMILDKIRQNPELQTGGGLLGDQGQPTDERLGEEDQRSKEETKGTASYQLQQMLNTTLSDKDRYPLKTENLVVMRNPGNQFPMIVNRDPRDSHLRNFTIGSHSFRMSSAAIGDKFADLAVKIMYIDPAGGGKNGDETGYCVAGLLNSNIFVLEVGGVPGGYEVDKLERLSQIAAKHKVNTVVVEKNFGHGAFKNILTPVLMNIHNKCSVDEIHVSGMKEKRIAETLGPIIGRSSLIMLEETVEQDLSLINRYSAEKKMSYSLYFQLAKLMLVKNSLEHDDRLDALSGACLYFVDQLSVDQKRREDEIAEREKAEWMRNFNARGSRFKSIGTTKKYTSMIAKYRK